MKTKIEDLKANQAAELEKAIAENEVVSAIESATGKTPESVHFYPLYGVDASVTFGNRYGRDEYATLRDALELAEAFPPVARLIRRDGCTSFPTEAWFDAEPGRSGEVQTVSPFFLEVDTACTPNHGHTPTVAIKWAAEIAGRVVSLSVILNPHTVCRWSFNAKNMTNAHAHVIDTELAFPEGWAVWAGDSFPALHHQDGGDNCERMERIKWGRGSADSGHKFTFYSGCGDADLAHHIRRLLALQTSKFAPTR
jgi:hypothetical protein